MLPVARVARADSRGFSSHLELQAVISGRRGASTAVQRVCVCFESCVCSRVYMCVFVHMCLGLILFGVFHARTAVP